MRQKLDRSFAPVSMSLNAEIGQGASEITLLSGSAGSVKQYFIFAFNGQAVEEEVTTFAKTRLNGINTTGKTTVDGHEVYSYKVSGNLPTPSNHLLATDITLANAFYSLTDATTSPVAISASTPFTTYMVGVDITNNYYVITSGSAYTNYSHLPKAQYWRVVYGGPFFDRDGDQTQSGAISVWHGFEAIHSGITDLSQLGYDDKLPAIPADSQNVTVKKSTTGNNYTDLVEVSTSLNWNHNDSSKINNAEHAPAVYYNGTVGHADYGLSKGGVIQYEFPEAIVANEVIYAHVMYDTANWGNNFYANPTYVSIEYSLDGVNWVREHQYVRGTDLNGNLSHGSSGGNPSPEADVMFLQRDIQSGAWKPGVIKRSLHGHGGSPDVYPEEISTGVSEPQYTPVVEQISIETRSVDWSGISGFTPDYQIDRPSGGSNQEFARFCATSEDGKTILVTGAYGGTNNGTGSGNAFMLKYNESTDSWDSTFLNRPTAGGSTGHYGVCCALSADAKLAVISGSPNIAWVWKYNDDTSSWEEGTFVESVQRKFRNTRRYII